MRKPRFKKIALISASVFLFLTLVLCVHIYIVTRPKPPNEHTLVMARIDIKQDITQTDANTITAWMFQQKGIDHVLVNPKTRIVVFTFFPIKTTGDAIVAKFKSELSYKADRIVPTAEQLSGSCPVASTSVAYKLVNLIKRIL